MPTWLVPMAATLTEERFAGPDWLFERKYDGIRLLAYRTSKGVRLYSRNQLEQYVPAVTRAIAALPIRSAIFDGELISGDYHIFDVLWLDGQLLTSQPLEERRARLAQLPLESPLQRVPELTGAEPWTRACAEGWEGVIAKRRGSRYEHRRSPLWLKMKCEAMQEFVVGGFTDPQRSRQGFGALLVGYYDGDDFVFAGKVGTGFDTALLTSLRARFDAMETAEAPFTAGTGLPRVRAHWVRPEIVVQVAFTEWTRHGKLRHSRLLGLRTDKNPRDVVRESA